MKLVDHIDFIEQAASDMAKFARGARKAITPSDIGFIDSDVCYSLLISVYAQLEVLKLRCATLRASKEFKELGT